MEDSDAKEFWERVNALIKEKNITQTSLSTVCGFNARRIQNLSGSARWPDAVEASKIALALGTSVEYLVTGSESNPYREKFDTLVIAVRNLPVD